MSVGERIRSRGWKQGAFIDNDLMSELATGASTPPGTGFECGVVISQSCDLLHHSLHDEPLAEVVLGTQSVTCGDRASRGNLTNAKNARVLCVEQYSRSSAAPTWIEFRPHWRVAIERSRLIEHAPDSAHYLTEQGLRVLIRWIAQRYDRAAFPDSFNDRLKPADKKLRNLYKRMSSETSGLYARLIPDRELNSGEKYSVDILATVPEQHEAKLAEVQQTMEQIAELMATCEIEARALAHLETEVPISAIRPMKRFPLESLSLPQASDDPMPVGI